MCKSELFIWAPNPNLILPQFSHFGEWHQPPPSCQVRDLGIISGTSFSFILHIQPISKPCLVSLMAPHSSTLAWKIPWTGESGRLQSMGSWRVGHDWATSLSCIGEGNGNPLQCSCLENPRDGGAWWAAVCGVAQSQTRLKRFSSSSSSHVFYLPLDRWGRMVSYFHSHFSI